MINKVFPYDGIYEVIIGSNGDKPNLAPIGIIKKGNVLKSKIYKDTVTFHNFLKNSKCSINVVYDGILFAKAFFNELEIKDFIDYMPVLKQGIVFLARTSYEKIDNPTFFYYEIYDYRIYNEINIAFNRGSSLLVDLLVHLSRLDIYKEEEIKKYLPIISYEIEIIRRTYPQSMKIIERINDILMKKGLKI